MFIKIIRVFVPRGTKRERWAKLVAHKIGLSEHPYYDRDYQRWMEHTEPEMFLPVIKGKSDKPLFSIVVPFFNTPDKYLFPLVDSIANQSFQNWELIAADASTDKERAQAIAQTCELDNRIKYHELENNSGISGNTNQGIEKTAGDYIVFCDHDDVLSLHALNEMAHKINESPDIDILYSDEDKLSDDGNWRHHPFFKPRWSPHTFLHTNYTNHLSVVRKTLVESVGGLRPEFDGSQDYDLLLRIHANTERAPKVGHVSKVLYYWREAEGSTAINHSSKSYAFEAGRKALQEYVDTINVDCRVENINDRPGFYHTVFSPKEGTKAVVYVGPTASKQLNGVFASKLKSHTKTTTVEAEFKPVTKEELENAPEHIDDNTVVFKIRTTALPEDSRWLEQLAGILELPDVAAVAPRILTSDGGLISDMGFVLAGKDEKVPLFKNLARSDQTPAGITEWVRDVDELSGAIVGHPKQPRTDAYQVVWSHVNFRKKQILQSSDYYLNSNLELNTGSQVVVNE